MKPKTAIEPIAWNISTHPIPYLSALKHMQGYVPLLQQEKVPEQIWLLEHPSVFTLGTSAQRSDLLSANDIPVIQTGRGGQITYHGPGQRMGYVMLNLKKRTQDVRLYVWSLEESLIRALAQWDIPAERREKRVGLWVTHPVKGECKIAAIGIRIEKWITYHGFCLNINPDLNFFNQIIPCGITEYGITSLEDLGIQIDPTTVDQTLKSSLSHIFE